jgi:hypothetical protein
MRQLSESPNSFNGLAQNVANDHRQRTSQKSKRNSCDPRMPTVDMIRPEIEKGQRLVKLLRAFAEDHALKIERLLLAGLEPATVCLRNVGKTVTPFCPGGWKQASQRKLIQLPLVAWFVLSWLELFVRTVGLSLDRAFGESKAIAREQWCPNRHSAVGALAYNFVKSPLAQFLTQCRVAFDTVPPQALLRPQSVIDQTSYLWKHRLVAEQPR